MNQTTILVADDDAEIRDIIHIYLRNEGFRVVEAQNGAEALQLIETEPVRLIILDVMMPVLDGIRTCLKIRENSHIPIIMLSAKEEDIDKITGLSTGADDYVTKPFSPLELLARVKAQLRRQSYPAAAPPLDEDIIRIRDMTIDCSRHEVVVSGKPVLLTPLEFAILKLLASHRGQVMNADLIYERVWKEKAGYSDNTVMVHIRNIREKLEPNPREPRYIKTVWGVGYKVEA
ncbi:response regulator transcription factor [Paenibacillus cymbidii]|uniref:response regulator transcription factor n=1 Tax=Paenibacillus cymbidii TaxID=1639034 RepID=UPI0010811C46|nr:response regulator transcription factor [Paenibacillus cymbidii]